MTAEELKEKRERFRVYGEICLLMEEKGYGDCTFEADELEEALGEPILVFVDDDDDHAQKLDSIEFADCMLWLSYGENYVMFMDVCSWTLHQIYEALKNFFQGELPMAQEVPKSQWKPSEEYKEAVQLIYDEKLIPFKDGNQWCFLLGYNIQVGVCGFGDSILEAAFEFYKEYTTTRKCIGELSRPQSYFSLWKPSDEQIVALQEAMNIVGILTITGSEINSLYQDLKKLREE